MRFRILLGLLYAPNPFGAYRAQIDYPVLLLVAFMRGKPLQQEIHVLR